MESGEAPTVTGNGWDPIESDDYSVAGLDMHEDNFEGRSCQTRSKAPETASEIKWVPPWLSSEANQ